MKTVSFQELVEINPRVNLSRGESYPFVPMSSLKPGQRYVTASEFRQSGGGAKFCGGDTLFARITPCLENGKIAQFKAPPKQKAFGSTEYWIFRAKEGVSDPSFIFYLSTTDLIRKPAEKSMSGASGRQRADVAAIYDVQVPGFDLSYQRRIASTLSAYDDLIENNTRRIEILEEMARRLYEEWFVHFRFPGHEEVSFKESELGEIPEKWEVRQLEEVVALNPRTKVPKEGEKWFVPMGALSESSMVVGSLEKKSGNSGAKFQNGDTLVARITPCLENGKTGFVDFLPEEQPTACGSTEFIVLRSISLCPEMVYLLARSDRFRDVAIKSMSGATGRQRVRVESLVELPVVQPDHATLEAFQRFVVPCFKQVRTLALKNANLRAQRDLLLPKLVSGEIDVSDITMPEDKEVEAA
jgi:type I restriction enzyme S subunit